jgi:hypothetical protein
MPPDLTLRLDAPTTRAHRSLEIASRFPPHPQRCDPLPGGRKQTEPTLATANAVLDTGAPRSGVAAFEVFLSGRFWTFGERERAHRRDARLRIDRFGFLANRDRPTNRATVATIW